MLTDTVLSASRSNFSFKSTRLLPSARRSPLLLASASIVGIVGISGIVPVQAQSMIEFNSGIPLAQGVGLGSSSAGDFDGDGDLDLLVTGFYYSDTVNATYTATIYENTGQNQGSGTLNPSTFQDVGAGLTGVGISSSSVGDFDGDGDLDLLITGGYQTSSGYAIEAKIYENTGQNQGSGTLGATTFQDVGAILTGVYFGSTSIGDFDGDGDLDILITGNTTEYSSPTYTFGPSATIYENTGQNQGDGSLDPSTFQEIDAGLDAVVFSASSVEDFDGDGDLDLLISGSAYDPGTTSYDLATTVYENTGQNLGAGILDGTTFSKIGAGLTGIEIGTNSVGDFDGDGDVDLFIAGYSSAGRIAEIYENTSQNQGSGTLSTSTFQSIGAILTGIEDGDSDVADLDGDGDLDIVYAGLRANPYARVTLIYENTGQNQGAGSLGSGTFEDIDAGLTDVDNSSVTTADFDGDLDIDLLITGANVGDADVSALVYDNTSNNPIPVELVAFTVKRDSDGALLQWTTASEEGNAGFEVQKLIGSAGSGVYEPLGFVDGAGTTSEAQSYQFRTDALPAGLHRFRLKQVDLDGSVEYSDAISVQISISEVYRLQPPSPNPTAGGAQIRLTVDQQQTVRISVLDLLGREVQIPFAGTLSPQTERTIRVGDNLVPGIYFVRVKGEGFRATERLTIIR